jgi:hypothetical protein
MHSKSHTRILKNSLLEYGDFLEDNIRTHIQAYHQID